LNNSKVVTDENQDITKYFLKTMIFWQLNF